jgi:hypothetical protein
VIETVAPASAGVTPGSRENASVTPVNDDVGAVRVRMLVLLAERAEGSTDQVAPTMRWPSRVGTHTVTRTLAHRDRDLARRRLIAHLMGDR